MPDILNHSRRRNIYCFRRHGQQVAVRLPGGWDAGSIVSALSPSRRFTVGFPFQDSEGGVHGQRRIESFLRSREMEIDQRRSTLQLTHNGSKTLGGCDVLYITRFITRPTWFRRSKASCKISSSSRIFITGSASSCHAPSSLALAPSSDLKPDGRNP